MEYQNPSSSVAVSDRSSIRHRSGTFTGSCPVQVRDRRGSLANIDTSNSSRDLVIASSLTVQVEDADNVDGRPTVLLVQSGRADRDRRPSSASSPALPFHNGTVAHVRKSTLARAREAEFAARAVLEDVCAQELVRGVCEMGGRAVDARNASPGTHAAFSPIPLTPHPQQRRRPPDEFGLLGKNGPYDVEHAIMRDVPTLAPTSFCSRMLSWRRPAAKPYPTSDIESSRSPFFHPPYSSRSASHANGKSSASIPRFYKQPLSSSSSRTSSSRSSSLNPFRIFRMNEKLTKKFPISASVRKLSALGRGRIGDQTLAIVLLDEAEGLGMNRVDRWTIHKWFLFLTLCIVFAYGAGALVYATLTWFETWPHANVMLVSDYDIVVLITLFASLALLTFVIGMTGTLLNSRPLLALYALLLWPTFIALLAIGYASYKRAAYSLDRKLNRAWSEWYTPYGRFVVQSSLRCCGYYSPLHDATASQHCYARSPLPGCKSRLLAFERANLESMWRAAFAVVPVHIVNVVVALVCANHVTRRFGKGVMPRQYRLREEDVIADAQRLAGVVRPVVSRASSSMVFQEDRKEPWVGGDGFPAVLRPGLPPLLEDLPYKQE